MTNNLSISATQKMLDRLEITSEELTLQALKRAHDPRGEGERVFTNLLVEQAIRQAKISDTLRRLGMKRSCLEGIPVSIKDLFDLAGYATTAGSKILKSAPPAQFDAQVVQQLNSAGAVLIGRTNMTEFAFSGLGINPHYGTPANPWQRNERLIPGGSSSGAAVAVTDGMCLGSIGTDTGGSVRIPAALCGITGYKPTAGRMSAKGVLPLSISLDSVGVLAHDVAGCAALDAVLTQAVNAAIPEYRLNRARFAVPSTLVHDGLDEDVATAFEHALTHLSSSGVELVRVAIPEFLEIARMNQCGGFAAIESWAWHADFIEQDAQCYDPRVLKRILRGKQAGAREYIELQQWRREWQQRVSLRLASFDAWLMPTVAKTATPIAVLEGDDQQYDAENLIQLRNPSIVNLLNGCAISLPCQMPGQAPVGLSLVAAENQDSKLFAWAIAIEKLLQALHQQ
jgi:aspartyl-tRNA(Asn)/glutamyl-tRNA(Gln) amidotransferase subunit A